MATTSLPLSRVAKQEQRGLPYLASKLRVSIVSDAIRGRNGVGTYYPDLLAHVAPKVGAIHLICPEDQPDPAFERFAFPVPGDATQRIVWPRTQELARRLDAQQPNLIVIPSIGPMSYFAIRYARKKDIPLAIVNHTNFGQLLSLYWSDLIAKPFQYGLRQVNKWIIRQASIVAAMNAEGLRNSVEEGAKFARVMGTPLSSEFMTQPLKTVGADLKKVVFVGRLAGEKGVPHLLEAAKDLPSVQFTIAGDGPLGEQVRELAKTLPNLRFLGWCNRSDVLVEMDRADMLVLPSKFETFGTVALEALARQRFVLASRQCGIADWSNFAEGLFYIEPGEKLSTAIARVQEMDHGQRMQRASQGWKEVRSFNEITVRNWIRFLVDGAGLTMSKS